MLKLTFYDSPFFRPHTFFTNHPTYCSSSSYLTWDIRFHIEQIFLTDWKNKSIIQVNNPKFSTKLNNPKINMTKNISQLPITDTFVDQIHFLYFAYTPLPIECCFSYPSFLLFALALLAMSGNVACDNTFFKRGEGVVLFFSKVLDA